MPYYGREGVNALTQKAEAEEVTLHGKDVHL